MAIDTERKWHNLSIEETATGLETDLAQGLSTAQVAEREAQFGPNALAERPRPGFLARLWAQLNDFLILILIVSPGRTTLGGPISCFGKGPSRLVTSSLRASVSGIPLNPNDRFISFALRESRLTRIGSIGFGAASASK